jgi:predicted SnoaL-like aldol condensation-catalyzing enzyme
MISSQAAQNKAIVLKAFDTLFNDRDYAAAEYYWSTDYIQHSAHIEPGRDGLFNMIKRSPASLKYQSGIVMAEGDLVIVHGRFSGFSGAASWASANVVRIRDRILVEHWDVLQEEETRERAAGQSPMYDRSHLA